MLFQQQYSFSVCHAYNCPHNVFLIIFFSKVFLQNVSLVSVNWTIFALLHSWQYLGSVCFTMHYIQSQTNVLQQQRPSVRSQRRSLHVTEDRKAIHDCQSQRESTHRRRIYLGSDLIVTLFFRPSISKNDRLDFLQISLPGG